VPRRINVVLAITLVAAAGQSLSWQMRVDAPLLAYTAMAIDLFGAVPYRDIFDFNTPGAYLSNIIIGRVYGYTELGFRLADLTVLAVILGASTIALRGFGIHNAVTAALLFGLTYLSLGPSMSLQREYLLLVPVSIALAVAVQPRHPTRRAGLIGLLLGIAATIKPQSLLVAPVFTIWVAATSESGVASWRGAGIILCGAVSCLVPVALTGAWLWWVGAIPAFIDMASNYWPLYNELTGIRPIRILGGTERWWWNAQRFFLSRDIRHLMVLPAIAGAWFALNRSTHDPERKRIVWLLIGLFCALQIYPLTAGKFWGYHWLPSMYVVALLSGLCFAPAALRSAAADGFRAAMLALMLTALWPGLFDLLRQAVRGEPRPDDNAVAIAGELGPRLRAGDRVQPLDWTGGAAHALFLTHTRIATPFLYDFYFYHHVSSPYIQSLRRRFVTELNLARPAFIVATDQERRFEGPDTTSVFHELSEILRRDYRAIASNERFVIYERYDHAVD
jgi:hypothetical protein